MLQVQMDQLLHDELASHSRSHSQPASQLPSWQPLQSEPAAIISPASRLASPYSSASVGADAEDSAHNPLQQGSATPSRQSSSKDLTSQSPHNFRSVTSMMSDSTTGSYVEMDKDLWATDASSCVCGGCNKEFGVFRRRHHCRRCGHIFCSKCSSYKFKLVDPCDKQAKLEPKRVCHNCHHLLNAQGGDADTRNYTL